MIDQYLQIETRGLVLLGDFNPAIFQPFWLASKNLIREEEAKNAKIEVIINELSRFQIGGWLNVEVSRNRCEFKTMKSPYFLPMKDLVVNIFKILPETPIKAIGINNIYDLSLKNKDSYYQFGNILAPLANWSDVLDSPRLLQLEIISEQKDSLLRRVSISPTDSDLKVNFGVNFNVNNHFTLQPNSTGNEASTLITEKSEYCANNSREIVSNILSKILR